MRPRVEIAPIVNLLFPKTNSFSETPDEEETPSTPMPLESPGPPLSFRHDTKKKIKKFVIIFGPGWCKTDDLMLSLMTYLALSLVHDAPALLKVPMEGTAKRPVDFYGRGYLPELPSPSLHC